MSNLLEKNIRMPKLSDLKLSFLPAPRQPTKTTLNLCASVQKKSKATKVVPLAILCLVAVVLIGQFAVAGRWQAVAAAQSEAQATEDSLAQVQAYTQGFEALRLEYAQYFPDGEGSAQYQVDRMDLLTLIETSLLDQSRVEYVTVAGDRLTARLAGISLDGTAQVLARLGSSSLVQSVSVSTADKDDQTAIPSVILTVALGAKEVQP